MTTRRDFLKHAALLSGAAAMGAFPESIARAMAIAPDRGTTFLDAEHVVILMQENRSFDHTFGALRGVRGFNDPRAIRLPDGSPVWAQPSPSGERYLPFRLDIKGTKSTWMGSLPHSWTDQVDARNNGHYDRWLDVKHSGEKAFAGMPLTMGYYTRDDIPFYYSLADAFTVCDQNFCSSLTGTTPNRLHLWSGTVRAKQDPLSKANILNSDVDYGRWADWTTFPERLEDAGVSWKVYQNELSLTSGLTGEHDAWLSNFTDNPLEWFSQYNVRFAPTHRAFVARRIREIPAEIAERTARAASAKTDEDRAKLRREVDNLTATLARFEAEATEFTQERYAKLSERERRLHERAFCVNADDPKFRDLAEHTYRDGQTERTLQVPAGDPLHQFRSDVHSGKLPTVSWLVPSERFSDHPGSAWYGAWYLSEVLDILTKNPEVWKKTVFILTYDENDGYFDHVPPFVAPDPRRPETGRVSRGIDPSLEFVPLDRDREWHPNEARESPIGLGYRVPMVIASPWTRGGAVCSQVFDHTSVLQFLERLLSHRTGKKIEEPNINQWRRAVCGDLTAAFTKAGETSSPLSPLQRDRVIEDIHKAQFKGLPTDYRPITAAEVDDLLTNPAKSPLMPRQEPGVRPSCPLPYELFVSGALNPGTERLVVRFEARRDLFAESAAGAPFTAYVIQPNGSFTCRNYAVRAGDAVEDTIPLTEFASSAYHLRVYGPSGFFRELRGNASDPSVNITMQPAQPGAAPTHAELAISVVGRTFTGITIHDHAYGNPDQACNAVAGRPLTVRMPVGKSAGWYDFSVTVSGSTAYERRFAGRLETGAWSTSDPAMA
jgi:phospholipase C